LTVSVVVRELSRENLLPFFCVPIAKPSDKLGNGEFQPTSTKKRRSTVVLPMHVLLVHTARGMTYDDELGNKA
jgi:hypothetical protein